ncbi:MAG TPA: serine hydrolase [Pyrinomonadaceae bacterium]|nr:serine hydrolase [Pyrinomonadaceae bacterium]
MVSGLGQDKAAQIDELMKQYNSFGQFNGSVLVAENGNVILKKGYGLANMEWKVPNEPDTKFRLGSITKQFTATLILQLVEQGKIKLDGKVTDYLSDYRKDTGDKVTIHQLLNHTSGIPSYTGQPGFFENVSRNPFTVADFVKKHCSGDLEFEPGSKFAYNNSGYFLLGAIVEKVSGKSYEEALKDSIFAPLGMKNSGYDNHSPLIDKRATGYSKRGTAYINSPYLDMSIPYAAGSLYSTVEDLYLWDQALYGDKVLSAASKELMFKPYLDNYGYGFVMREANLSDGTTKVPTISHGGGINGFNTLLTRLTGKKQLIVLLDNTEQGRFHGRITSAITNILHGQKYDMAKRSIGETVSDTIAARGVAAGVEQYRSLKAKNEPTYNFDEAELNSLGYRLLSTGKVKDAIEIFKLNAETYPKSANPYDSLGEAYLADGQKDLSLASYKKALEIDPKFASSIEAIKRIEAPAVAIDSKEFPAFVGKYQLFPNFVIEITNEDGKLFAQGTGQPKIALEPTASMQFAVRQIGAEITFVKADDGIIKSLILNQGGRKTEAKRL